MMTDPISDMLTRIRNANRIERPVVDMPSTHLKVNIAKVLKDEGFILDYQTGVMVADETGHKDFQQAEGPTPKAILRVFLKYGPEGERVIRHLRRVSKPGLRVYRRASQIVPVLDGLGISIISTSRGVKSDRQARAEKLGGEMICNVW
jgi:small subunit ribosomal protein S8